jgi:RNA polymerase sigma factor (sigma-70 family)
MGHSPHSGLAAAARVGAGWAFDRLYRALGPAVLGYLRSQGCIDPEGSVNDVFLRAFRAIERFEGDDDDFRSWVFTIAHNVVIDERRSTSRRPATQPLHDRLYELVGGDVEEDAMTRSGQGTVRQLLSLLAPDQRDVLLLRVVAELSLAEVARATGRSVGAVKSLQHRALASLRRHLEEIPLEAVSSDAAGRSPQRDARRRD